MKKYIYIIGAILLVVGFGFFVVNNDNDDAMEFTALESSSVNDATPQESSDEEFESEEGPKLYIGDPNAQVIITEFVDYNCPNCNTFHRTVKNQIEDEYGDSVAFEIHQTPFIGPDSGRAARGAYCSQIHGDVFAGYHDGVFDYMYDNFFAEGNFQAEFDDVLTAEVLTDIYTQAGGSETNEFSACLDDQMTINKYINNDQLLAAEKEVRGTPSFVVGDTSLVGPQQFSVFKALIEAEL